MQTKTYFANNVPSALEVARQELGADALLVNSRPAPAHARHFGRLEVTFAWDPPEAASVGFEARKARLEPFAANPGGAGRVSDLDQIRRQLTALSLAVGQAADEGSDVMASGVGISESPVAERLLAAGLSLETAREIGQAASGDPQAALEELTRRIPVAAFAEMKAGETRTLAFFGPPGRGKTTSLVKVAINYGLARKIPVRIYSVGAHGVGGHEQIARFAAILGAPFHSCDGVEYLNLALNGDSWKGLVLIDTPGFSPRDEAELTEMNRFFALRQDIEKHLVLRSDARSADSLQMISRFRGLNPSRLLFTGTDEATGAGSIVDVLIRTRIAATFLGTGPQIPEDLEEAGATKLARSVWNGTGGTEPSTKYVRAAA